MSTLNKSNRERLLQALGFEILAVALSTPLFAWIMATPWVHMGALTLANSAIAVLWNLIFNASFDHYAKRHVLRMGVVWRSAHAVLFEGGLFLITVPLAAWWLGIHLAAAVLLDMGLLLFFLPYTYVYHWAYDTLRAVLLKP